MHITSLTCRMKLLWICYQVTIFFLVFVNFRIICKILFSTQLIFIISNPEDITCLTCFSSAESKSLAYIFCQGNCSLLECQDRGWEGECTSLCFTMNCPFFPQVKTRTPGHQPLFG